MRKWSFVAVLLVVVVVAVGATVGRHTHFGEEVGYVQEGTLSLEIDGVAKTVKAGEAFIIPNGKPLATPVNVGPILPVPADRPPRNAALRALRISAGLPPRPHPGVKAEGLRPAAHQSRKVRVRGVEQVVPFVRNHR